jgi:asparagine synthase
VVAFNGSTRVHGTLAATHEIFYADVDGIVVAANKASILARIAERAIRREMLATTLLAPRAPWPLSDRPLWKGVEHVPVTDALELHSDGCGALVLRWSYPLHREPLTDIAPDCGPLSKPASERVRRRLLCSAPICRVDWTRRPSRSMRIDMPDSWSPYGRTPTMRRMTT